MPCKRAASQSPLTFNTHYQLHSNEKADWLLAMPLTFQVDGCNPYLKTCHGWSKVRHLYQRARDLRIWAKILVLIYWLKQNAHIFSFDQLTSNSISPPDFHKYAEKSYLLPYLLSECMFLVLLCTIHLCMLFFNEKKGFPCNFFFVNVITCSTTETTFIFEWCHKSLSLFSPTPTDSLLIWIDHFSQSDQFLCQ